VASKLSSVRDALDWLLADGKKEGANVVCLSLGDDGNYQAEQGIAGTAQEDIKRDIAARIRSLRQAAIPTVVAVGNGFRCNNSVSGMAFPAILPECLSVGALFKDGLLKNVSFGQEYCDASIISSQRNQVAPFSQRLPRGESPHYTRLFAPGVEIVSLGIATDTSETPPSNGTSLAAPFVAGVIALMQELHKKRHNGELPSCDKLEQWLLAGGQRIVDDAGVDDNVTNTGAVFKALDALGALNAMEKDIPTALWHLA
jgi:subtilisin family serine protease